MNPLPTKPSFGGVGVGSFTLDPNSTKTSLDYFRNLIQTGQLNPGQASGQLYGSYSSAVRDAAQAAGAPGYAIGGDQWNQLQSQLFQPMNIIQNPSQNMTGRQGFLTDTGAVQYQNPYMYKSVTSGLGSTGKGTNTSGMSNEQWIGKPVVPYSGPAPKLSAIATPNLYQ